MTTPQIVAAVLAVLTVLSCWLYLRASRRRKVSEQSTLDRAVREERHLSLVLDDPTDEPLEVDPPVIPRYLGSPYQFDGDSGRRPPIGGVWS